MLAYVSMTPMKIIKLKTSVSEMQCTLCSILYYYFSPGVTVSQTKSSHWLIAIGSGTQSCILWIVNHLTWNSNGYNKSIWVNTDHVPTEPCSGRETEEEIILLPITIASPSPPRGDHIYIFDNSWVPKLSVFVNVSVLFHTVSWCFTLFHAVSDYFTLFPGVSLCFWVFIGK